MDRRRFITASAGGVAAVLAGCSTDDGAQSGNDSDESAAAITEEDPGENETDPADDGMGSDDTNETEPETNETDEAEEQTEDSSEPEIEILEHRAFEDDWGDVAVVGQIENTGDVTVTYLEVEATFYDADGNELVGRGEGQYAYADNVEPGDVLQFEIITWVDYADVDDYELELWIP